MTALRRASPCSRGGFGSSAGIAMGEQGQPDFNGGCGGAGEEDEGVGVGGGAARLPTGEWKRGMTSRYSPPPRPRRLQRHRPRLLHHSSDYNSSCPWKYLRIISTKGYSTHADTARNIERQDTCEGINAKRTPRKRKLQESPPGSPSTTATMAVASPRRR